MKNLFAVSFMLIFVIFCYAKDKPVSATEPVFQYSYVKIGSDSVLCQRTPEAELGKLAPIPRAYAPSVERSLTTIRECVVAKQKNLNTGNCFFDRLVVSEIQYCQNNGLDVTNYRNELDFYLIKQKELNEKIQEQNDSILNKKAFDDSLLAKKRVAEYIEEKRIAELRLVVNDSIHKENLKRQAAKEAAEKRQRYQYLVKKYGAPNAKLMVEGRVKIGWTKQMCIEAWGEPNDINTTINQYHRLEQWVYSLSDYLYFEDGILITIQN